MEKSVLLQLGLLASITLSIYLSIKLIRYLRRKTTNTELWGTIFEGLTHYTVPQEPLKDPAVYIEKKTRKDGQDKDPLAGKNI